MATKRRIQKNTHTDRERKITPAFLWPNVRVRVSMCVYVCVCLMPVFRLLGLAIRDFLPACQLAPTCLLRPSTVPSGLQDAEQQWADGWTKGAHTHRHTYIDNVKTAKNWHVSELSARLRNFHISLIAILALVCWRCFALSPQNGTHLRLSLTIVDGEHSLGFCDRTGVGAFVAPPITPLPICIPSETVLFWQGWIVFYHLLTRNVFPCALCWSFFLLFFRPLTLTLLAEVIVSHLSPVFFFPLVFL